MYSIIRHDHDGYTEWLSRYNPGGVRWTMWNTNHTLIFKTVDAAHQFMSDEFLIYNDGSYSIDSEYVHTIESHLLNAERL